MSVKLNLNQVGFKEKGDIIYRNFDAVVDRDTQEIKNELLEMQQDIQDNIDEQSAAMVQSVIEELTPIITDAQDAADTATNTANEAKNTANSAKNIASAAETTVTNAQANVTAAQQAAEDAQQAAQTAAARAASDASLELEEDVYNAINTAKTEGIFDGFNAEQYKTLIANVYEPSEEYNIGDYVTRYDSGAQNAVNKLYRFTKAHEPNDGIITEGINQNAVQIKLTDELKNIVLVQDTQPTEDSNRIWVTETDEEVEVPTYEEFTNLIGTVPSGSNLQDEVDDLKSALFNDTFPLFEETGNAQMFNKFEAIYVKDIAINSSRQMVSASGHNMLIFKVPQRTGDIYTVILNNNVSLSEIKIGVAYSFYDTVGNTLVGKIDGNASTKKVVFPLDASADVYMYLDYKLSDSSYADLRNDVVTSTIAYATEKRSYYKNVDDTVDDKLVPYVKSVNGQTPDISGCVDIDPLLYDIRNDLYNRVFEKTGNTQIYDWRTEYNKAIKGYAINSNGVIVSSTNSFILSAEINGEIGESFSFNIFNDDALTDLKLRTSNDEISPSATTGQTSPYYSASAKRGYITLEQNAKYIYISLSYSVAPTDETVIGVQKRLVVRTGIQYGTEYVDYYKFDPSINAETIIALIEQYAVALNQSILSEGKILVVGSNGVVVPGEIPEQVSANVPVRYYPQKSIQLDASSIDGSTSFSGTNWSGTLATGFTHATGSTDPLVFDFNTTENAKYLVTFACETLNTKFYVSIGNSQLVDPYNGGTGMYVGFVSDGGKLKITPASDFNGTITDLKLRKLNASGAETFTYNCSEIEHGSMVNDISGFWNIALGGPHVLSHNQNGARNIGIGYGSLEKLVTGIQNIVLGTWSMPEVTTGTRNVAVGCDVLYGRVYQGEESKAFDNVAIGKATMRNGTLIEQNVAVGIGAMSENTEDAKRNVGVGYNALKYADKYNVGVGFSAGAYSKGTGNTSVGYNAGNTIYVSGNDNVCIGNDSGFDNTGASAGSVKTVSNAIAVGYNVKADNNQACFGNSSQTIILAGKKIVFNNDNTVTWENI